MSIDTSSREFPVIDLSVVTHNSSKWVERFFVSLFKQNFPTNKINLLIRDNRSTDDTLEQCRTLASTHRHEFFGIHVIEDQNRGFGYGHNQNLKIGQGSFFLVSNVDLEFAVDAIREVLETAMNDDATVASWEFRQKPYEHPKYYNPVTLETAWSSSACILFRRSMLEMVGGYEERIFLYGEDVELSYRLRDHGFKLKYCPKAVCWHYTYEEAYQLKPIQFFGSALANIYIRMRYGSLIDIICGLIMYFGLWIHSPALPAKRRGLLNIGLQIGRNAFYFLTTRKKSQHNFPLNFWDYGLRREGAFYEHRKADEDTTPLVSIVMRTYKGRLPWLREAVISVLNQTYPRVQLIVVEDGSDDARDFLCDIANRYPSLSVLYRTIPKAGRCHAGNVGMEAATGSLLAFLDDDDLFFSDHIETLVSELVAHPDHAAAYGLAFSVPTIVATLIPLSYEELRFDVIHHERFSRAILWHHNYMPIQTVVFRRELFDEYGGFDPALENLEDWNLWTRYSLLRDFILVEKVTSLYRVPGCADQLIARQKMLNKYYADAVAKQKSMTLMLTPAEVMAFSQEISRNINAIVIPYVRVRDIIVSSRFLNVFYYVALRLMKKLRRRRTQ